jgi:hypothetical protein
MSSYVPAALRRLVSARAAGTCEYCRIPDAVAFYPHEVDHVIAEKHGGETIESNLCLSCWECNRHKGTDLTSVDLMTGAITPIFNPRRHLWHEHFYLETAILVGITAEGRTTVKLLRFNDELSVELRTELIKLGRYL